jgi:hypothetical protein
MAAIQATPNTTLLHRRAFHCDKNSCRLRAEIKSPAQVGATNWSSVLLIIALSRGKKARYMIMHFFRLEW